MENEKKSRYYSSGKLFSECSYLVKEGKTTLQLHGPSLFFAEDGTLLSSVSYQEGKKEGREERYYLSGALYSTVDYKNGKKVGTETYFQESGEIKISIPYESGRVHGVAQVFRPNGETLRSLHFEKGKPVENTP